MMQAQSHPDFFPIESAETLHSIKIDQIRELTRQLTQKSQRRGYQVVVISQAETLTLAAANALLKTLEEPPGDVIFLLITDVSHQLPLTIVSRCQQIYFDESACAEPEEASFRYDIASHLSQVLNNTQNPIEPVAQWIEKHTVLDNLFTIALDIARLQWGVTELSNPNCIDLLAPLSQKILPILLQEWMIKLIEIKRLLMSGMNLNKQLCLEDLMIRWRAT
jgi:DNA polymerase III delta prime subunit